MSKESLIQQTIISNLSALAVKHNFVFFAPMNELFMTALIMFKVPKYTRMRLFNWCLKMGFLPGVSDIEIVCNGQAYFIEVKNEKGKQSDKQIRFMNNVLKAGCDYAVVRSWVDVEWCLEDWGIV